jgi:hypothetical protein
VARIGNEAGVSIIRCQLGMFGYRDFGSKGVAADLQEIPAWLSGRLNEEASDGELTCAAAWHIADTQGLPRLLVASAADAMGLHITRCQLGCF